MPSGAEGDARCLIRAEVANELADEDAGEGAGQEQIREPEARMLQKIRRRRGNHAKGIFDGKGDQQQRQQREIRRMTDHAGRAAGANVDMRQQPPTDEHTKCKACQPQAERLRLQAIQADEVDGAPSGKDCRDERQLQQAGLARAAGLDATKR